eukprot:3357593-Alexandrium_andersonii.AAC.1
MEVGPVRGPSPALSAGAGAVAEVCTVGAQGGVRPSPPPTVGRPDRWPPSGCRGPRARVGAQGPG